MLKGTSSFFMKISEKLLTPFIADEHRTCCVFRPFITSTRLFQVIPENQISLENVNSYISKQVKHLDWGKEDRYRPIRRDESAYFILEYLWPFRNKGEFHEYTHTHIAFVFPICLLHVSLLLAIPFPNLISKMSFSTIPPSPSCHFHCEKLYLLLYLHVFSTHAKLHQTVYP